MLSDKETPGPKVAPAKGTVSSKNSSKAEAQGEDSSWLWAKGGPVFVSRSTPAPEPPPASNWLWAKGEPLFVSKKTERRGRKPKEALRTRSAAGPAPLRASVPPQPETQDSLESAPPQTATEEYAAREAEQKHRTEEKPAVELTKEPQPVKATREELSAGKLSRVWNARLMRPDYALSHLWEGYFALQNGAVLDLQVSPGKAFARVDYEGEAEVEIDFSPVELKQWEALVAKCGISREGWVTLLTGNIVFEDIRRFYVDPQGLIPSKREVAQHCTCALATPQGCVHSTTTLLALGAWLQAHPLDLLTLRSAKREVLFEKSALLRGERRIGESAYESRRLEKIFGLAQAS